MREEQPPAPQMAAPVAPAAAAEQSWARYIMHVSGCPGCRGGIACRTVERLHTGWKAAQKAARSGSGQ